MLGGAEYLQTFSIDQQNTLAFLSLRVSGFGGGVSILFYGVALVLFGYLMARSGYLPRALGALVALGGFAFVTRSFAMVLAPAYASPLLYLPVTIAGLALTVWLLVRGVDVKRWEEKAALAV